MLTGPKADIANSKVFEEPLMAIGETSAQEIQALAKAMDEYVAVGRLENLRPIQKFLLENPASAWRLSLLVNLGLMHRHLGQSSEALRAWEAAWDTGKSEKQPLAMDMANRALGELLEINAGLGRQSALENLVREADARPLSGLVTEKLSAAKESLAFMRYTPAEAFRCGPMALTYLRALEDPQAFKDVRLLRMQAGSKGTNLSQNAKWAGEVGLKVQMARRKGGDNWPTPSVVHMKLGHFAVLIYKSKNRYLIQDPFLGDTWVSSETLDQELSGYALIPSGKLPKGWEALSDAQGEDIWGCGAWGPGRPDDTRPDSHKVGVFLNQKTLGAPRPAMHTNVSGLNVDIPLLDDSSGPAFMLTYNQREYGQPQVFDYCNAGHKWTFSYLACIKDDSTNPHSNVAVCYSGGGGLIFQSKGDGSYRLESQTCARLERKGAGYSIHYPDGRTEFYEMADRAWGLRRIVLTRIQNSKGREVKLTWDAQLRLRSITDAENRTTLLDYELKEDPLKLTRVSRSGGPAAQLHYNAQGQLNRVVHAQGGESQFEYGPSGSDPANSKDFLRLCNYQGRVMQFRMGEFLKGPSYLRWVEIVHPDQSRQRLEAGAGYAYVTDPEVIPRTAELDPAYHPNTFTFREAFFWSNLIPGQDKLDYRQADHYRFGHGPGGFSSGLVVSSKIVGQPRHWFVHAGDLWGGAYPAARSKKYPLNPDGLSSAGGGKAVLPIFDGTLGLLTREYWIEKEGFVEQRMREFDHQGRPLTEAAVKSLKQQNFGK